MVKLLISLSSNVFVHWWSLSTSIIPLRAVKWHCLACPFLSRLSGRIPVSFWQPECTRHSCVVALNDCSHNSNSTVKDFLPKKNLSLRKFCETTFDSKIKSARGLLKVTVMLSIWNAPPPSSLEGLVPSAMVKGRTSEIWLEHEGSSLISKIIH